MVYNIKITQSARKDMLDIYEYVFYNDSIQNADILYQKLREILDKLKTNPERGHTLVELALFGVTDIYEIRHKLYRIIYSIKDSTVYVHCVIDGRRDLDDLLHRKLIN